MYVPKKLFATPLVLLVPTAEIVLGSTKKTYPPVEEGVPFFGSFATYGGTEITNNGVYSVENTANIETWYRPEFKASCRIVRASDGVTYEVVGEPENIEQRNMYVRMKVKSVRGGA